jgi:hypothetical protein
MPVNASAALLRRAAARTATRSAWALVLLLLAGLGAVGSPSQAGRIGETLSERFTVSSWEWAGEERAALPETPASAQARFAWLQASRGKSAPQRLGSPGSLSLAAIVPVLSAPLAAVSPAATIHGQWKSGPGAGPRAIRGPPARA